MKTKKTNAMTPILLEEAPQPTLSRRKADLPSTQVFAGWGPRISV